MKRRALQAGILAGGGDWDDAQTPLAWGAAFLLFVLIVLVGWLVSR